MSTKYPGGFITKSPVAPTSSAASGIWTLDQQQQAQKAGTWPAPPMFIEDLFSTYLYTGNGSTQTITNNIDLSGQGGLVWVKMRSNGSATGNVLFDTARGASQKLETNTAGASSNWTPYGVSAFGSTGFTVADDGAGNYITNNSGVNYVSWTFREQPKFFDIVTATNTGGTNARISHNLGSVPGFVIVKSTDYYSESWRCYHRSIGRNGGLQLNLTDAAFNFSNYWGTSDPTATDFGINWTLFSGTDYIFYFFAHDAGGFPASGSGSTNGISCGSFTTAGSGGLMTAPVDLGYEPQWLLIKNTGSAENWKIYDTSRGMAYSGYSVLYPNLNSGEAGGTSAIVPTATGFNTPNASGPFANSATYIYIAVRRGPMKTPTTGTSVFDPEAYSGDNLNTRVITTGFPPDMVWTGTKANGSRRVGDRLRGLFVNPGPVSTTSSTSDEQLSSYSSPQMSGWQTGNGTVRFENSTGVDYVLHAFKRAPGFFDVVCGTGTGAASTFTHNLGVAPELVIWKSRNGTDTWRTLSTSLAKYGGLDTTSAFTNSSIQFYFGNDTTYVAPTATTVYLGQGAFGNGSTYVAYLFATLAGVSKVGTYTGTSALLTVNCGFTSGARFVLIKRTDSTGDWYLYDSARGITAGDDPYLLINSSSAEVTGTNYVDTDTTGFKVTAAAPAELNASGGTYIFLAIA